MSIELGNTGANLPVGGVIIGGLRVETGEFRWLEVPVSLFQDRKYEAGEHYFEAADIAVKVLDALHVPQDESISFLMDFRRREVLTRLQGAFSDVQRGPDSLRLQQWLAGALQQNLAEAYGFQIDLETLEEKPGLAFYRALEWAKGGSPHKIDAVLPEREALCKTEWPSWRLWADNLYPEAKKLAADLRRERQKDWEARKGDGGGSGAGVSAPRPGVGKPPGSRSPKPGPGATAAMPMSDAEWEERFGGELPF